MGFKLDLIINENYPKLNTIGYTHFELRSDKLSFMHNSKYSRISQKM